MSTAFHTLNKSYRQPSGVSHKENATGARKTSNSLFQMPSSRLSLRNSKYVWDPREVPDDDLITLAQRGEQKAFVELLRRYSPLVKNRILRIVRNQEDAEDALQDTLLRAYTHLVTFRRSCKFATWISTIGENSALMILRKRKVRQENYAHPVSSDTGASDERELVDPSPGPEVIYLKQQTILLVQREVQKLQPNLRSIVDTYYRSDNSLEESAKALDISVAAAKSRLMRGRVRLRSSLARVGVSNSGT